MNKLFNNKKGNYQDIPEYVRVAMVFFFLILISFLVLNNFNTGIQSNSNVDSTSKSVSSGFISGFLKLDYVLPAIYIIFLGFSILAARFIPSSSKFMIITVIFLVLIPFFGMITDNITNKMLENGTLQGASSNFRLGTYMFTHMTLFSSIYSFLVGFALLTKGESSR